MVFQNPEFGKIRTTIDENGEPLFCLADLCGTLALDVNNTVRRLDDGVCSKHPIPDILGRIQLTNFVNEDGLYDVILDSRKPEARRFRKWITSEVLPSIRKTGSYGIQNPFGNMSAAEISLFAIEAYSRENGRLRQQISSLQTRLQKQAKELTKLQAQKTDIEERKQLQLEAPNYFSQFLGQTDLFNEPNKRVKMEDIWIAFQTFCLGIGLQNIPSRRSFGIFLSQHPLLDKGRTNFGVYYYKF